MQQKIFGYYVPETLDLALLDGFKNVLREKLMFFVSTLYLVGVTNKSYISGDWVRLNFEVMGRFIGRNHFGRVKSELLKLGIIEENKSYLPGSHSKSYRFTPEYRTEKFFWMDAKNKGIVERVRKEEEKLINDIPESFRKTFSLLDDVSATMVADDVCLDAFIRGQRSFSHSKKTGRIFYALTSIKKENRKNLRFKGEPLVEVDVANCQPLLLATLYPDRTTEEANRFLVVAQGGLFYEALGNEAITERSILKRQFVQWLFNSDDYDCAASKAFKTLFPDLAQIVIGRKKGNNKLFVKEMQGKESKAMIETVLPQFSGKPAFPVHDSFLTLAEDAAEVRKAILGAFVALYALVPTVRQK